MSEKTRERGMCGLVRHLFRVTKMEVLYRSEIGEGTELGVRVCRCSLGKFYIKSVQFGVEFRRSPSGS